MTGGGPVTLRVTGLPAGGKANLTCSDLSIALTEAGEPDAWTAILPNRTGDYIFTGDGAYSLASAVCKVAVTAYVPTPVYPDPVEPDEPDDEPFYELPASGKPAAPAQSETPVTPDAPQTPVIPAPSAALVFADVAPDAWYREAVEAVAEVGLMNGVSTGKFAPELLLTRAMLARFLLHVA